MVLVGHVGQRTGRIDVSAIELELGSSIDDATLDSSRGSDVIASGDSTKSTGDGAAGECAGASDVREATGLEITIGYLAIDDGGAVVL